MFYINFITSYIIIDAQVDILHFIHGHVSVSTIASALVEAGGSFEKSKWIRKEKSDAEHTETFHDIMPTFWTAEAFLNLEGIIRKTNEERSSASMKIILV